jgi:hypothetical protein
MKETKMNTDQPPTTGTTPPGSVRAAFSDEVQERGIVFGQDLLKLIPELESVAIIPAYTIQQDQLPSGIIASRTGQLQTLTEAMHMAVQLHRSLRTVTDTVFRILAQINETAKELRLEVPTLNERIISLQATITDLETRHNELTAEPGDPGPPIQPSGDPTPARPVDPSPD